MGEVRESEDAHLLATRSYSHIPRVCLIVSSWFYGGFLIRRARRQAERPLYAYGLPFQCAFNKFKTHRASFNARVVPNVRIAGDSSLWHAFRTVTGHDLPS